MSEYADGFDDGKGEKFDELMEEIVSLREQLKDCSAAFDRQQEQLDRNAEQNAALQKKKPWVGLTGTEVNHIFAKNVGYPERMMKDVENLLKENNGG